MTAIDAEFVDHRRFERVTDGSETTTEQSGATADRAESETTREHGGGEFEPTANDWDATVTVADDTVEIAVVVPTLDAATTEPVADVVEDGWFDTFERRVADADGVTLAKSVDLTDVTREDGDITVELTLTPRTGKAADDALALINFVEGTWFQGVIPGYDYVEEVQEMRQQAAQNAQSTDGTPL